MILHLVTGESAKKVETYREKVKSYAVGRGALALKLLNDPLKPNQFPTLCTIENIC